MKIVKLNGLITIESDEGKVLTTLSPSTLRTKLIYLGKGDNLENYVEIDEEPDVEIDEEPNTEAPEEVLNGLSLVEAYHYLLSENRVLKEENKKQNELIDLIMMTMDEMYVMIEPFIADVLTSSKSSKMIDMYVAMVIRKLKDKDNVPIRYRDEVEKIINQSHSKE